MPLQNKITDICRDYEIADLYVFGSRAPEISNLVRGLQADSSEMHSDLDVGIQPQNQICWPQKKRVQLTIDLEDLFQVKHIDLVLLPEADPERFFEDPRNIAAAESYLRRGISRLFLIIESLLETLIDWLQNHPDKMDQSI